MPVNTGPLLKILELERKKGFNDSSVFGGLDKFLHNWMLEASTLITGPNLLRRFNSLLVKTNYASLSPELRQKWANEVIALSQDVDKTSETKIKKPADAGTKSG